MRSCWTSPKLSILYATVVYKLVAYDVAEGLLEWFKDYLSNQKQKVLVGGENSTWTEVLSGVPQGSVLGPLLFVVYINDQPEIVDGRSKLFADDSKILSV